MTDYFLLQEDGNKILQEDTNGILLDVLDVSPPATAGSVNYVGNLASGQFTITMDTIGVDVEAVLWDGTNEMAGVIFLDVDVGDADYVVLYWRYGTPEDTVQIVELATADVYWNFHGALLRAPATDAQLCCAIGSSSTTATSRVLFTALRRK